MLRSCAGLTLRLSPRPGSTSSPLRWRYMIIGPERPRERDRERARIDCGSTSRAGSGGAVSASPSTATERCAHQLQNSSKRTKPPPFSSIAANSAAASARLSLMPSLPQPALNSAGLSRW